MHGSESADNPRVSQLTQPPAIPPQHLQQMFDARARVRKVRRAIAVAKFDAWATAIFAGLTLLIAVPSFSLTGLLVGGAMAFIATQSFRGLHKITRLDESGARLLGYNQIIFAICLIVYAAWNLYRYSTGPAPFADVISEAPETKQML